MNGTGGGDGGGGARTRGTTCGRLAGLLLLAASAGCGNGDHAAQVAAFDDLVDRMAAANCAWQFRCCTGQEIAALSTIQYRTEEACVRTVDDNLGAQLAFRRSLVSVGRMSVNAAQASACVAAIEARPCNTSGGTPLMSPTPDATACVGALVGAARVGELCYIQGDCAPGALCAIAGRGLAGAMPTLGVCVAPVEELDAPCGTSKPCDPARGLTCSASTSRCMREPREGDPCGFSPQNFLATCSAEAHLFCDSSSDVCRHMPRAGDPCSFEVSSGCDPDPSLQLSCVGSSFNGTGICLPPAKLGEPCGGSGLAACGSGLICSAAPGAIGTCTAGAGPGDLCTDTQICSQGGAVRCSGMLRAGPAGAP